MALIEKVIELQATDMRKIAAAILDVMNAAQGEGYSIDQVLGGTAYALGAAIAQRGGVLLLQAPLEQALSPLVRGYRAALAAKQQD